MKREHKNLIFILLLAVHFTALSQRLNKDSLERILLLAKDSTKVRVLNQLSEAVRSDEPQKAVEYAQRAYDLSQRIGPVTAYLKSARNMGYALQYNSDYSNSTIYFQKAVELAESTGTLSAIADSYFGIAQNNFAVENLDKVLEYDLKALRIYEKIDDKAGIAKATYGIAAVYLKEKKSDIALGYLDKSLSLFEANGDQLNIAFACVNIGVVHMDKREYDEALKYFSRSLEIFKLIGRLRGVGAVMHNIGNAYYFKGNLEMAVAKWNESLAASTEAKDKSSVVWTLIDLADFYQNRYQYDKSLEYLNRALPQAKDLKLHRGLSTIYLKMAEISRNRGDYKGAYAYHELYSAHYDSAFNAEKSKQVHEMQARFEIAQREKEIEILKKDKETSQFILIVVSISSLILIVMAGLFFHQRQLKRKKDLELAQKEKQLVESELEKQKIAKQNLLATIDFNQKSLTAYTLNLVHKNEMLEEIKTKITSVKLAPEKERSIRLNSLLNSVNFGIKLDEDWENFNSHFQQVNEGFLDHLKKTFPDLSVSDLRLCSLIKLRLETKQIASLLGISNESTKVARSRVRKKLGLTIDQNLPEFLSSFSESKK